MPFRSNAFFWVMIGLWAATCLGPNRKQTFPGDDPFFQEKNRLHNGDYLATYPLHNPDSCILRLQSEVPRQLQPWACTALWYHLPRDIVVSFRLLDLYERNYPHDTVHTFAQTKRAEYLVDAARFQEADSCLQDVERISLRLHRRQDLSDVYFLRGRMEMYRNNFSASRQALFTCLEMLNEQDTAFTEVHAIVYHAIGSSYERAQQTDAQRVWLSKIWAAKGAKNEVWKHRWRTQAAISIGIGYLNTRPDSSLLWAKEAEQIVKQALNAPTPPRLKYLFGRAYAELKQCGLAVIYLLDAYKHKPERKEVFGFYQYAHALGHAYLCAGRLDSAEVFLREALASPDTGNLAAAHQMLADLAAGRGDFESAWEHQKTSTHLFRAKYTIDRIQAAAETDTRYEALEQSKRVAVLEKEHQINRLKFLSLALLLTFLSGVAAALYHRQRRRQKILQQKNRLLEQEKQLAELRAHLQSLELERSQSELRQTKDDLHETAVLLDLKNQLIETLELRLREHTPTEDVDPASAQTPAERFSAMRILTKEDWKIFLEIFSTQFPDFLVRLQIRYPNLTSAEIRLFILIKIGFDTRQISDILGISHNSVWRSRHRLVKSLGLDTAKNLDDYVKSC